MTFTQSQGRTQGLFGYLAFCSFIFLLVLYYAVTHTWEYDEAWTWLSVKNESFTDLLLYRHFNIANNHLLNSLWFKVLQLAGVKQALLYRSISLLSYFAYAAFLYKVLGYGTTDSRPSVLLSSLFFLPPVVLFFAAGRGYALSMACFVGAFYYLKVYIAEKKASAYWLFFILGLIASLSIVSFFYPFVAMLIYVYIRRSEKIVTPQALISAVIFLALTGYIYYIGKTIILHDKIINGTGNLLVNGMYSSFISFLGVNNLFPFPGFYDRFNLLLVTKLIILVTFLPAIWVLLRKYLTLAPELMVLVMVTVIALCAHLILKAMYPSDRSVIYLLYLIYAPMAIGIVATRNKYLQVHYYTVIVFAVINMVGYFYVLTKPELYKTLAQTTTGQHTIISDWPNWADDMENELYFDHRFHFEYIAQSFEKDLPLVDEKIKAAVADPDTDLLLLQKTSYKRNLSLFTDDFIVQPVMSSGAKELFLIKKRTAPH